MAYHYMLNAETGEARTVRTETLERYHLPNGGLIHPWHQFENEAERDAFMPTILWAFDPYTPGSGVRQIARDQRGYWRQHGREFSDTETEARAAMKEVWYISGREVIRTTRRGAGVAVTYPTEGDARAALPPTLWAMDRFGDEYGSAIEIAEANRGEYDPALYIVAATREDALAGLPMHYSWREGKWRPYAKQQGATPFRSLRSALRQIRLQPQSEYADLIPDRHNIHIPHVLMQAWRYHKRQHPRATGGAFAERVNIYTGHDYMGVCRWCDARPVCRAFGAELGGQRACQDCLDRRAPCTTCGAVFLRGEMRENDTGQLFCEAHPPVTMDPPGGKLLGYTVNVLNRKEAFLLAHAEQRADLWLGWELEVYPAPGHTVASCVMDVRGAFGDHCICKADSTISAGFEIVSVPATLQWHREHSVPFLRAMRGKIEGWKHDNAGLHVHVGRKELSALQIGRMSAFIDHPSNTPFVNKIAGRGPNDYARRRLKKLSYSRGGEGGRYSALNLETTRGDTAELRIFRSNVAPLGFLKALEFTHALASWARFAGNFEVAPSHLGIKGGGAFKRAPNPYDEDEDEEDGETPYADYEAETLRLFALSSGGDDRGVKAFLTYAQKNRGSYPKLWQWLQEVGYASGLRYESVAVGE